MNEKVDQGFKEILQDKIVLNIPGFQWSSHGRGANIYFVENQSITIIYAEMPAVKEYDVLVFGETKHINKRYYPNDQKVETIPTEERFRIQHLLVDWLASKGMRHDINVGK
ncbi:hypothetical protein GC093_07685 [Paenibacillus sp. LMG 31456]|uniref:Uncharacterized protein n=1 Tax=Paenibacillus foliorum TaxID=2654974 RepID=A0A972GN70_9BACL|nr:hypothetical protein [Paenibacillus foliorum]NOU93110.1 hypothetical protein [Paenibacillus foliorum]